MTCGEALRALARSGWRIERPAKGSHVVMARGADRQVLAIGRRGKHSLSAGQRAAVRRATRDHKDIIG